MAVQINELQARMNRDQAVELVGEAAEVRLKADLKKRFPDDKIIDIPKGKKGADLEQHVTLEGSGTSIGMILIERKSTKAFLKPWIPNQKKDYLKQVCGVLKLFHNKFISIIYYC